MDDRVVGLVIMFKTWVVVTGMVEDLEGKVKVLLAGDDSSEAFRVEFLGPRFDWGSNSVRFEKLGFGLDSGEVVVGRVGYKGIYSRVGGVVACVTDMVIYLPRCL